MKRVASILAVVLLVVCGIGTVAYRQYQSVQQKLEANKSKLGTVETGDLVVQVVESGTIDAVKVVEVKSRASGRLAELLVEEGDLVSRGDLIARIDPQETQFKVEQDRASLRGAESAVRRLDIEIAQREATSQSALRQARYRVDQIERELNVQPTLTHSAIVSAEAAYRSALQERERLKVATQPNARTAAETSVRDAQASYDQAKRDLERQARLKSQGYVSSKAVEAAELNLSLSETKLRGARESLERLDSQLRLELARADEDVLRSRADLDRAKANAVQDVVKRREYESALEDLRKAEVGLKDVDAMRRSREQSQSSVDQVRNVLSDSERQLRETEIRSPIDGIVAKKLVQEGELVASLSSFSSGTPIVRIEDRAAMMVKLNINEIDVAKLRAGMPASIDVDALPNQKLKGSLKKISPASSATISGADTVVKYAVEIWLDQVPQGLRSGMSARCTLEVARANKVLFLPIEYVGKKDDGTRFVELPSKSKDPKAAPTEKKVQVGLDTGSKLEIKSGLNLGDKVQRPKYAGPSRKSFLTAGPEE